MRPDYVDRYDLKNFKRLRKIGHEFKTSYVGHSPSVTVVSHAVMTTGLLPKDLPWEDEVYIDSNGVIGSKGKVWDMTKNVPMEPFFKIYSQLPKEDFLAYEFKEKTKKKVRAFGEKDYAILAMGGPYADSVTYFGKKNGVCTPVGHNVPDFIAKDDRFTVDCKKTYGTEMSYYTLDGSRYFPGDDAKHLGGDVWTADAAIKTLETEKDDIGALFLTFGAIDKFGHMLGEADELHPLSFTPPAHLKDICKIADEQLGKILDYLEKNKMLESTMIVATADHGGQTNKVMLGTGTDEDSTWVKRLKSLAKVKAVNADTSIRVWVDGTDDENMKKAFGLIKESSRVTRIYQLSRTDNSYTYKEVFNVVKNEPLKFQKWANAHDQEIANTMAREDAPTFIAFLADNVGYGKPGDHGGDQEHVQSIPMFIAGPVPAQLLKKNTLRLVDIKPIVEKAFGFDSQKWQISKQPEENAKPRAISNTKDDQSL
jgi:hypothetical protein